MCRHGKYWIYIYSPCGAETEYSALIRSKPGELMSLILALPDPLQWRHNERDGVSIHHPHDCLLNRLFRRRSNITSKLRTTGLCEGNSPVTGEFPAQRASDAENVCIWWRHYVMCSYDVNNVGHICLRLLWGRNYTTTTYVILELRNCKRCKYILFCPTKIGKARIDRNVYLVILKIDENILAKWFSSLHQTQPAGWGWWGDDKHVTWWFITAYSNYNYSWAPSHPIEATSAHVIWWWKVKCI